MMGQETKEVFDSAKNTLNLAKTYTSNQDVKLNDKEDGGPKSPAFNLTLEKNIIKSPKKNKKQP